jgi:hypothetical protein
MKRIIGAACLGAMTATPLRSADPLVEIGYVESFDKSPNLYLIKRQGQKEPEPVTILTPVYNGDVIEVSDPTASIRIRLVDRPEPVVISKANEATPLAAEPPKTHFVSSLYRWVSQTINIFDHEEREVVAANIRGGSGELAAPALAKPQTLMSGTQAIVVGWSGARQVSIRLTNSLGHEVASGRGSGGIWSSPPVKLDPGRYTIELKDADKTLQQSLQVVSAPDALKLPDDTPIGPPELRETAVAAWLAAKDERFILAALQHVAPYARENQPARLLTKALVTGHRPTVAPPSP